MNKVVCIGGGTGLSNLLKGLKRYDLDLTAIVTVADDGGSSGKLRESFNMPPPGDIRKVLVSLSRHEKVFKDLINYRFDGIDNNLDGHTVGNIIIAALTNTHNNNFSKAISCLSDILNIEGKVIPVSKKALSLKALYNDDSVCIGESNIPKVNKVIKKICYTEDVDVNQEAIKEIKNADLIILSCGSLYTSLLPNLIIKEIKQAIENTSAKIVYVANICNEQGETNDFLVSDHIKLVESYLKSDIIDMIIANNNFNLDKEFNLVTLDYGNINTKIYASDLIYLKNQIIKHDYKKISAIIHSILLDM